MDTHTHSHEAAHFSGMSARPLKLALLVIIGVAALEVIGGILSNSLALVSDAGHMLVDILALALALFAMTLARRPATRYRTFGFHRAEIVAALANGVTLVLLALYVFYSAYTRLLNPPDIETPVMLVVAFVGLLANVGGIMLLRRGSSENLNMRAALWHVIGDTVSSVGVLAGGLVIHFTGLSIIDPIIALLIGGIIAWGAVRLVGESVEILLETVPRHISVDKVVQTLKTVPGVEDVHDIHVWTITSGLYAMSGHIVIKDQMVSRSSEIIDSVNETLAHKHEIKHTTLQLECRTCTEACVCDVRVQPTHHEMETADVHR